MATKDDHTGFAPAFWLFVSAVLSASIGGFLANQLTLLAASATGTPAGGWALVSAAIFFAIGCVVTIRYWIILGQGAFGKETQERKQYDRLRKELRRGGGISQTYVRLMRVALSWIDRAYGDRGVAQETALGRMIGLKEHAPQWTAISYDRSLFLAVVYPCLVIFGMWGWTGHVGPVEASLQLPAGAIGPQRALVVLCVILVLVSWVQFVRQLDKRRQAAWGAGTIICMIIMLKTADAAYATVAFATALASAYALGVWIVVARSGVKVSGSAGAGASAVVATGGFITAMTGSDIWNDRDGLHVATGPMAIAAAFLAAFGIALAVSIGLALLHRRGGLGRFQLVWTVALAIATFASPIAFASLPSWSAAAPILLFVVLLGLVNAPFDWLALGLTRALFRRGLQGSGWAPLIVGLADLVVAVSAVIILSFAILLSVQMFEQLSLLHGGAPILYVRTILNALADPERRWEPQYFWIYMMVFSTMLPSALNIAIGSLSVLRGIPGLNRWAAKRMPVGKAVLETERLRIVPVLTIQVTLSGIFGLLFVAALFWTLWSLEISGSGSLLSTLRETANANLPFELLRKLGVP